MGAITHISKRFSDELVGSKMAPTSYQGWKENEQAATERSAEIFGTATCRHCERVFVKKSYHHNLCGRPECFKASRRKSGASKKVEANTKANKPCPVCGKREIGPRASACRYCRARQCKLRHEQQLGSEEYVAKIRARQAEQKARHRAEAREAEAQKLALALKNTACPFQDMQTHCECKTWDCAEMDPMTSRADLAVRVNVVEQKQKREKAA